MPRVRAKRWCFTINNYTEGEVQLLSDLLSSEHVEYGIYGREQGENGTPHLQGYVIFKDSKEALQAKRLISERCHIEKSNGTPQQAADYCKKDGDFNEYGSLPNVAQGKRSDWDRLKSWCDERTTIPSDYELFDAFPSLYGRYKNAVREICRLRIRVDSREIGQPRDWQRELEQRLDAEPDNRSVFFVVDEEGNQGKTWFAEYYNKKHPGESQRIRSAKRDDMAWAIQSGKRVYFIDVPRGGMELFQYGICEMVKDRAVFSPKYESCMKEWDEPSHVVVLCNENPDLSKMSADRFVLIPLGEPDEFWQPP